jgi:hypothetical protein
MGIFARIELAANRGQAFLILELADILSEKEKKKRASE